MDNLSNNIIQLDPSFAGYYYYFLLKVILYDKNVY